MQDSEDNDSHKLKAVEPTELRAELVNCHQHSTVKDSGRLFSNKTSNQETKKLRKFDHLARLCFHYIRYLYVFYHFRDGTTISVFFFFFLK